MINKFNRGEVSPLALARDDVSKISDTCELMDNFMPMRLGPMRFRPGFEYIGDAYQALTSLDRSIIPMTRSLGDSLLMESIPDYIRPLKDGVPYSNSADTIAFTNPSPTSSLTGWTASAGVSATTKGARIPYGDSIYQTITTGAIGDVQTLEIWIYDTPALLQIGEGATGGSVDIMERVLSPGQHFIRFTSAVIDYTLTVTSVDAYLGDGENVTYMYQVKAKTSADVVLPSGFASSYAQTSFATSADVMFIATGSSTVPQVFKRVGGDDFSIEKYLAIRGPYSVPNTTSSTIRTPLLTVKGEITLSSSTYDFEASNGDQLVEVSFSEQKTSETFAGTTATPIYVIFVRGYDRDREIFITISGGGTGTLELQRKNDAGTWETVRTYEANGSDIYVDRFDDELKEYGFISTVTAGSFTVEMEYVSSLSRGHGLITNVSSDGKSATVNVYDSFMKIFTTSKYWRKGLWKIGSYPRGVTIYEGRVVWASKNRIDMTVTDDYYNFDEYIPGASAAISRTIGFGATDDISWVESSNQLFAGSPMTEMLVRSSNFGEPLTNLNTNIKPGKGVGSKSIPPVSMDETIYFVSRDGKRVHGLGYDVGGDSQLSSDQMMMHPTICEDGIKAMTVTKNPEYRLWVLTDTGELRVLLKEPTESVQAWSRVTVNGTVEDIAVIPNDGEDELWAIIRRTNSSTGVASSSIEKLSSFYSIEPLDSFTRFTSPGTATLTGLTRFEGVTVGVWADDQDRGDYTVASGQITIDSALYTNIVVGLRYTADYKSNKLGEYVADSVIGERKTVGNIGLVMRDYAPGAVKAGRDFTHLRDLPNATAAPLVTDYDEQVFGFAGASDTDSRICLRATGPCTIMALKFDVNIKKANKDG